MSAGGGGVNLEKPVFNYLDTGVKEFAHQMCAGARQMSAGGVASVQEGLSLVTRTLSPPGATFATCGRYFPLSSARKRSM
jgi:hypothetical protein